MIIIFPLNLTYSSLIGTLIVIFVIFLLKRRVIPNEKEFLDIVGYALIFFGSIGTIVNLLSGQTVFLEIQENQNTILFLTSLLLFFYSVKGIYLIIKEGKGKKKTKKNETLEKSAYEILRDEYTKPSRQHLSKS